MGHSAAPHHDSRFGPLPGRREAPQRGSAIVTVVTMAPQDGCGTAMEASYGLDRGCLKTVVILWLHMRHSVQDLLEIGTFPLLGFAG
jgi:hypothetical protein